MTKPQPPLGPNLSCGLLPPHPLSLSTRGRSQSLVSSLPRPKANCGLLPPSPRLGPRPPHVSLPHVCSQPRLRHAHRPPTLFPLPLSTRWAPLVSPSSTFLLLIPTDNVELLLPLCARAVTSATPPAHSGLRACTSPARPTQMTTPTAPPPTQPQPHGAPPARKVLIKATGLHVAPVPVPQPRRLR